MGSNGFSRLSAKRLKSPLRTPHFSLDKPLALHFLIPYVATGPDSKPVIDLIRFLERSAPGQVIALIGNHELLLLRAIHDRNHRQEWLANIKNWQTICSWAAANEELSVLLGKLKITPVPTQELMTVYQEKAKIHLSTK